MGFYDDRVLPHVINVVMDTKQSRAIRARVCAGVEGHVVEIGFGTGHNLPFLSAEVRSLRAVEPSGVGVRLARERIARSSVPVEVVGLDGQHLPLEDASADAVLSTWSLCTIPDPVTAFAKRAGCCDQAGGSTSSNTGERPMSRCAAGRTGSTGSKSGSEVAATSTATSWPSSKLAGLRSPSSTPTRHGRTKSRTPRCTKASRSRPEQQETGRRSTDRGPAAMVQASSGYRPA